MTEPAYVLREEEDSFESLAKHLFISHGIRKPPPHANHQDLLHIHHVLTEDAALYYAPRPIQPMKDGYPLRKIVERRPLMKRVGGAKTGARSKLVTQERVVVSTKAIVRLECGCELVRDLSIIGVSAICRREEEHKRYPGRIYPPERLPKFMVAT